LSGDFEPSEEEREGIAGDSETGADETGRDDGITYV
jgi:hypothetical protein